MASESNNKPPRMFKDKLLSLFGIGKPQKDEKGLPPKAHFSIWYFVLAMIFFPTCSHYSFLQRWRQFHTANSNNTLATENWMN